MSKFAMTIVRLGSALSLFAALACSSSSEPGAPGTGSSGGSLTVSGLPCNLVVTARDSSGTTATSYAGTVHFIATDPAAVLPQDYTFVRADSGIHSFQLTLRTAGSQSVTVTDVANSLTGSEAVTLDPTILDEPLYVTSEVGHRITIYANGATCSAAPTSAIEGSNTGLEWPDGIAVDPTGRVYVANTSNDVRQSVNVYAAGAAGDVSPLVMLTGGSGFGTLAPRGIALDGAGRLYVANANASINIYAPGATGNDPPTTTIAGPHTGLVYAASIAVDAVGRLYVSNFTGNNVLVFAAGATGDATPIAAIAGTNTGLSLPTGIVLDNAGRIFVANFGGSSITVFASGAAGNVFPVATIAGSNAGLNFPKGIALDDFSRLYVANRGNSTITVYAAGATGNTAPVARIATGLNVPAHVAFPTSARSGSSERVSGLIAFQSGAGIEAIGADGSGRRVLIPDPTAFEPAWSPDGAKLAFTRTPDGWNSCDIYTARADGSAVHRITAPLTQPWCANSPAWSPDGSKIAFSAGRAGCEYSPQCFGQSIYVVDADGSHERQVFTPASLPPITNYPMAYFILIRPTWSPDGRKLAFECSAFAVGAPSPDEFVGVCTGNVDGSGAQRLVECCPEAPAWSPDALAIAYQDNDHPGGAIGLMNSDGTGMRNLMSWNTSVGYGEPAWSPDGSRLVHVQGYPSGDLYTMNRDGTDSRRLTTTGGLHHPSWAPYAPTSSDARLALPRGRATARARNRDGGR